MAGLKIASLLASLALLAGAQNQDLSRGACVATTDKVECYFDVAYALINLNGMEKRLTAINGEFPGPVVRVRVGQRLVVHVHNRIHANPFSIHWHGMHHRGQDVWMDGVSYVTQCPIGYDETFTYDFLIQDTQHPGSYMYHGHTGLSLDSGVNGMLIIDPAVGQDGGYPALCDGDATADPATCISDEFPLFLTDIVPQPASAEYEWSYPAPEESDDVRGRIKTHARNNIEMGLLLNGRGQVHVNGTCKHAPPLLSMDCDPDHAPEPATFEMQYGHRYLFRMVNGGFHATITLTFVNHNVTVVGNGNSRVLPSEAREGLNSVIMAPGERVELIVTANAEPGPHLIYAKSGRQFRIRTPVVGCALMTYGNESIPEDYTFRCPQANEEVDFDIRGLEHYDFLRSLNSNPTYMHAAEQPPRADEVTKHFEIVTYNHYMQIDPATGHVVNPPERQYFNETEGLECNRDSFPMEDRHHTLDGIANVGWARKYGMTPMLMMAAMGGETFSNEANFHHIEVGDVVQIVFNQQKRCGGPSKHPMHMHGYSFWVMGNGWGAFNETEFARKEANGEYNQHYVDVFNNISPDHITESGTRGWVVIRFRARAAGIWPFHCHQLEHSLGGLSTFFAESLDQVPPPPEAFSICGKKAKKLIQDMAKAEHDKELDLAQAVHDKALDTAQAEHERELEDLRDRSVIFQPKEEDTCPNIKIFHAIRDHAQKCDDSYGRVQKGRINGKFKKVMSAAECKLRCLLEKNAHSKIGAYQYNLKKKSCNCYNKGASMNRKALLYVAGTLDDK